MVVGRWDGALLDAQRALTHHDETYMPLEVVVALKVSGQWDFGTRGSTASAPLEQARR